MAGTGGRECGRRCRVPSLRAGRIGGTAGALAGQWSAGGSLAGGAVGGGSVVAAGAAGAARGAVAFCPVAATDHGPAGGGLPRCGWRPAATGVAQSIGRPGDPGHSKWRPAGDGAGGVVSPGMAGGGRRMGGLWRRAGSGRAGVGAGRPAAGVTAGAVAGGPAGHPVDRFAAHPAAVES